MKLPLLPKKAVRRLRPHSLFPTSAFSYVTPRGGMICADAKMLLASPGAQHLTQKINLIFTSPPFPLNRKKKYGNESGNSYIEWLTSYGALLKPLLAIDGSIVIEMGNSWEPGEPVMSTLALQALLEFKDKNGLFLCQEFIWHNPAKLPTPAQWVNVERIRLKDSFTRLWWLSLQKKPKANNRTVLQEYSPAMKTLLHDRKYNSGKRPSEHHIGKRSFLTNNGGSIPPNVLTFANTGANDAYQHYCRQHGIAAHPARMPIGLARFFIKFLTDPGDLVLDPFAGSNTTGAAAEELGRNWIGIETNRDYVRGSRGRFVSRNSPKTRA